MEVRVMHRSTPKAQENEVAPDGGMESTACQCATKPNERAREDASPRNHSSSREGVACYVCARSKSQARGGEPGMPLDDAAQRRWHALNIPNMLAGEERRAL